MADIVVIANSETRYTRRIVDGLCQAGKRPSILFLGSSAENLLFKLGSLRRIWRQLGPIEAARRIRRSSQTPVPADNASIPTLAALANEYDFRIICYDKINHGAIVVELLTAVLPGLWEMDVFQWAILKDAPFGVTAHLVEEKVDAGSIIVQKHIEPADSGEDFDRFYQRLEDEQAKALVNAAIKVHDGKVDFMANDTDASELCFAMRDELKAKARRVFSQKYGANSR
ncbi:hypothetical protein DJ031_09605 [bacterium endosymbiont of Escarpia laminata]|nr:MAG: hypothetical protein DJ031_09605 [bacterium endosymbiont of Escarpia laminata]